MHFSRYYQGQRSIKVCTLILLSSCLSLFACTGKRYTKFEIPQINNNNTENTEVPVSIPPIGLVNDPKARVSNAIKFELPKVEENIPLPYNQEIIHIQYGSKGYVGIQGIIADASFQTLLTAASAQNFDAAKSADFIAAELKKALKNLSSSQKLEILGLRTYPNLGFFSGWVSEADYNQAVNTAKTAKVKNGQAYILLRDIEALKNSTASAVKMPIFNSKNISLVLEPTLIDKTTNTKILANTTEPLLDGRINFDNFSGLKSLGVNEFLAQTAIDLNGKKVDGSGVKVGVTDTGVTYNHVAFNDVAGKKRILAMKDFTSEGAMYFVSSTAFSARTATSSDEIPEWIKPNQVDNLLFVTAEVVLSSGAFTQPFADATTKMDNVPILASAELKEILLSPTSKVRLGTFTEKQFQKNEETIDLNQNGSTEDIFLAFMVPGSDEKSHQIYLNLAGTNDFSAIKPMHNFNTSGETTPVYAERIGVDINNIKLTTEDKVPVDAITASIVGFDPGSHGSHVSGIIGAKHIISNDSPETNARGIAPNTNIMVNRVCSVTRGCNGTEAFIDLAQNGAEVINMSLGGLSISNDGYGVQDLLINRVSHLNNTLFVISAGNSGPYLQTVGSPSTARMALSVAATANRNMLERQLQWDGGGRLANKPNKDEDHVFYFSSRGPSGNAGFKPNISAPGTEVSTIHFNAPAGEEAGLNNYWGTSMAAPAATGAIALLIDAAKQYNLLHSDAKMPLDVLSIRRALIESARPFDTTLLGKDAISGEVVKTEGQFTWIDQGAGMLSLPRAWTILKRMAANHVPTAFESRATTELGLDKKAINLEFWPMVKFVNRNGIPYTGLNTITDNTQELHYGEGLWLDYNSSDDLAQVLIKRALPPQYTASAEQGLLRNILLTTADVFELETTIYGSQVTWLKPGVKICYGDDCDRTATDLTLIGDGMDKPQTNQLYIYLDRSLMLALKPGDHGAIIKGYRKVNGIKENVASFVIPVYLTVPEQKMANQALLNVSGKVRSFQVDRHYVEIPEGTNMVKLSLEVDPAKIINGKVMGCSGVQFMVAEGSNSVLPPEIASTLGVAKNCSTAGMPSTGSPIQPTTPSFVRINPTPGIWDVHVFGRFQFAENPYKLKVEYRNFVSSLKEIAGKPEVLKGSFSYIFSDGTITGLKPDLAKSIYSLIGISATSYGTVETGEYVVVKDVNEQENRTYDSTNSVIIETGGMKNSDLDLEIYECDKADLNIKLCNLVAQSGGATDIEKATFKPKTDKFYRIQLIGAEVKDEGKFFVKETITAKTETGIITIAEETPDFYNISFELNTTNSVILRLPKYESGKYSAVGSLRLISSKGNLLQLLPVTINSK